MKKTLLKKVDESDRKIVKKIIDFMRKNNSLVKGASNKYPISQIGREIDIEINKTSLSYVLKRYPFFDYSIKGYDWKLWFLNENYGE